MRLSKQTIALAAVGVADLVTTLWLRSAYGATEANPLMALFLAQGAAAFVFAKVTLLAAPLAVIEWARRRRPAFVAKASTVALLAYLCLYAVGVSRLNAAPPGVPMMSPAERGVVWRRLRAELAIRTDRRVLGGDPVPGSSASYALAALRAAESARPNPHGPM